MKTITATELARNLRQVLDRMVADPEVIIIERNHRQIGRLIPGPGRQTALEAMSDLYRALPQNAGKDWLQESRSAFGTETVEQGVRDPWRS